WLASPRRMGETMSQGNAAAQLIERIDELLAATPVDLQTMRGNGRWADPATIQRINGEILALGRAAGIPVEYEKIAIQSGALRIEEARRFHWARRNYLLSKQAEARAVAAISKDTTKRNPTDNDETQWSQEQTYSSTGQGRRSGPSPSHPSRP